MAPKIFQKTPKNLCLGLDIWVTELVRMDRGQVMTLGEFRQPVGRGVRVHRLPIVCGHDVAGGSDTQMVKECSLLRLPRFEQLCHARGDGNIAIFSCFQCGAERTALGCIDAVLT